MEQRGREHDSWKKLVKKTINAKAKISLQLPLILCGIDQRCLRGNQSIYSTVAKSQASSIRYLCDNSVKKPLPLSASKPPNFSLISKTSDKKARREKKRYHYQMRVRQNSGPPAIAVNATNTLSGIRNGGNQKDASEAIYYNCNKKGHFTKNYSKP